MKQIILNNSNPRQNNCLSIERCRDSKELLGIWINEKEIPKWADHTTICIFKIKLKNTKNKTK